MFNQDLEFRKGFFDNSQLNEEKMKVILSKYYGAISQIDFQIGRIIEILKRKGLYENTLIIYTSDHGDSWDITIWYLKVIICMIQLLKFL